MPSSDYSPQDQTNARHYKQLGLEPGAPMRDIEAAYWRFARELMGQSAMAVYNTAYETLASSARPPVDRPEIIQPTPAPMASEGEPPPVRPPSKFGWPAL